MKTKNKEKQYWTIGYLAYTKKRSFPSFNGIYLNLNYDERTFIKPEMVKSIGNFGLTLKSIGLSCLSDNSTE